MGYQNVTSYRLRDTEADPGKPIERIWVRSLMVPPGFSSSCRAHASSTRGPCSCRVARGPARRRSPASRSAPTVARPGPMPRSAQSPRHTPGARGPSLGMPAPAATRSAAERPMPTARPSRTRRHRTWRYLNNAVERIRSRCAPPRPRSGTLARGHEVHELRRAHDLCADLATRQSSFAPALPIAAASASASEMSAATSSVSRTFPSTCTTRVTVRSTASAGS